MATKSLGKSQRDLLDAILKAVEVIYHPPFCKSPGSFVRSDNHKTVTGIALLLMDKGLVILSGPATRRTLVPTEKGRKWNRA